MSEEMRCEMKHIFNKAESWVCSLRWGLANYPDLAEL